MEGASGRTVCDAAASRASEFGSGHQVAFVVIAHNEAIGIADCLRSIASQQELSNFEVVVVDDGSTDATSTVLRSLQREIPELRVLQHETNLGRGAARAAGVRATRSCLIAMVDGDIVLPSDWLSRCH